MAAFPGPALAVAALALVAATAPGPLPDGIGAAWSEARAPAATAPPSERAVPDGGRVGAGPLFSDRPHAVEHAVRDVTPAGPSRHGADARGGPVYL